MFGYKLSNQPASQQEVSSVRVRQQDTHLGEAGANYDVLKPLFDAILFTMQASSDHFRTARNYKSIAVTLDTPQARAPRLTSTLFPSVNATACSSAAVGLARTTANTAN